MHTRNRIFVGLTLIALLLLGVFGASAQAEEPWSIMIVDTQEGTIIEAFSDGTNRTIDLGLNDMTYFSAQNVALDEAKTRAGFCAVVNNGNTSESILYIYDLASGERITERNYGQVSGCIVGQNGMLSDGSTIAVSLFNHYPDDPNHDANSPVWVVEIVDTMTGEVVTSLESGSEVAQSVEMDIEGFLGVLPIVREHRDQSVILAVMPYGTEGLPEVPAFVWNYADDTIVSAGAPWGRMNAELLEATGETAWPAVDESLPMLEPDGPMPPHNVVVIENMDGSLVTVPFTDKIVSAVEFINNGQQLAVSLIEPFDIDNPQAERITEWRVIDRGSAETETLITHNNYSQVIGLPDGYAHLSMTTSAEGNTLTITLTAFVNGEARELWSQTGANRGFVWGVIASPSLNPEGELTPFVAE